jgi:hypothetical protein
MTVPTNVQYCMSEHTAEIERTVKVTQHHQRKICVKSQPVSPNVRYHQQLCATLQHQHNIASDNTTTEKNSCYLCYCPTYSFSSVAQQGSKAPHYDVSRSHTIRHTHTHTARTNTHDRQKLPEEVIRPDNTKQIQQTSINSVSGFRTRNPRHRAPS